MSDKHLIRLICTVYIAALLLGGLPALASEEPADEALALEEPVAAALTSEAPADEAELPLEEIVLDDPAEPADIDPMAARMELQLDGGTKTFSDFTTRALNNEVLRKGIDVSVWQGSIDWKSVAASGVEFAIIRAAYRTTGSGVLYKDSYFEANIKGAKAAGLMVGVYIFSQAITTDEAVAEADYLMSLIQDCDIDLPLVFDFEYVTGGRLSGSLGKRLSTDICLAFCARVEAAGYESMVYANPSTLNGNLYPSEFGRVWLAHYTTETSYAGSYEYWQCSGSGVVSGVDGDVDLDFWFQPVTTGLPFSDVKTSDWFFDSVRQAYAAKIVSGLTQTQFGPNATATRGQVVTMLHRMMEEPSWSVPAGFTDLTYDYYKDAIFWAAERGIVSGFSEESFRPDQAITREQLVAILYRMAGQPEVSGDLSGFSDGAKVQSYARNAMIWAVSRGIISGYSEDGTIRPQRNASRAEVCAILMRYRSL